MRRNDWMSTGVTATIATVATVAFALDAFAVEHSREQLELFESRIRPVLVAACYACHSGAAGESHGGLLLDSRDGLLTGGDSGPAVVPGNADASLLLKAIGYASPDLQMSPDEDGGPLPAETVAAFRAWIEDGAADPRDNARLAPAKDMIGGKDHWAFRPLKVPAIPTVDLNLVTRRPLDHFVFAKQSQWGITPNPETDRRTLLRRVTYDLTGLPPTYEDVLAFVNDEAPAAYERVVQRLLASPAYGERWGRLWLDVARYSDTKGYLAGGQPQRFSFSHTYRDYVIDAFNSDKPFERFITEQLAADQLELGDDMRPLAALGYLTLGRRFLNNENDIIDDRIDVVTRGMLGLTVACARCHDHKFDPIPTADYYSLHGVFASSHEPAEKPLLGELLETDAYRGYLQARQEVEGRMEAKINEMIDAFLKKERCRSGDYLLGARRSKSLKEGADFDLFAGERQLNPHLLRRWIAYLDSDFAGNSELFRDWFDAVDTQAAEAKTHVYNLTFTQAVEQPGEDSAAVRVFLDAEGSPLNPPRDEVARWIQRDISVQIATYQREMEALNWQHEGAPLRAMALVDRPNPHNSTILLRGKAGNIGSQVPRQFLEVLSSAEREPFQHGSGRLELAAAIAKQPLAARVFVNRVWGWHFGKPLVATPSDFGVRTEAPVLVDALEWLAASFIESGGSVKQLHRAIVLSATYCQSSEKRQQSSAVDPENETLHHFDRRRLEFEEIRDTLLAVSRSLDRRVGGLPVDITATPFTNRRTVYGYIDRQNLPSVFRTFDFPNPDATSPQRFRTTVPQQALYMMNSPFVAEQAARLAQLISDTPPADVVTRLYEMVFQRLPSEEEQRLGIHFLKQAGEQATALYCQTLLLANETIFID